MGGSAALRGDRERCGVMTSTKKNAPAQRGNAGGGLENHEGAGLTVSVAPAVHDHHDVIRQIVDHAPPFTAEQRSRLSLLMRPEIPLRGAA